MQLERTPNSESDPDEYENSTVTDERAPLPGDTISPDVKQVRDHVRYNGLKHWQDKHLKLRTRIEDLIHLVHLQIAKVQFGVCYNPSNSPSTGVSFSVEYERDVLRQSAAYLSVVYEHKHIRIEVRAKMFPCLIVGLFEFLTQIPQRETEETNTLILVKFSSIRKLGIGQDESGQPCESPPQHHQRFARLMVETLQPLYSIYIHLPVSSKKHTNSGPKAIGNTRLASLFLRSMMPMPASHHTRIISILSSPIQTISSSSRRYATSWSVDRVPSAFPLWIPTRSNSSLFTISLTSSGG
jgi:hypothetical protein